jgi:hypothetical protein
MSTLRLGKVTVAFFSLQSNVNTYIHRVLSPIFLLKSTLFLSEAIKCMRVAKLVLSGFSARRPASFTNIDFCYVLFYTAALQRWRRGLTYLAAPSNLKYDVHVCRKMYSNTKM